jgi:hypothetical protein
MADTVFPALEEDKGVLFPQEVVECAAVAAPCAPTQIDGMMR